LGDWFEYHDKINNFIQSIPSFTQADLILDELDDLLMNTVRVKRYQIILMDEAKQAFSLVRFHPANEKAAMPELNLESPIFKVFEATKLDYFAMRLTYALPGETPLEKSARDEFAPFHSEFAFPFVSGKDPFGLLLIGEKETGEIYTRHDLKLFNQMLRHMSLVLNQIRLKNKLLQTEQMELLGTMSRGIAHDMNNLLTPVSTYLQLTRDGVADAVVNGELLPMALRNVETMRAYIHEALFFSKTQSLQFKKVQFEQLIHNVVDMVQSALKRKNIRLDIQVSGMLEAEIDEILVQRLVGNLISNAIDASRASSQIYVSVVRLGRMQSGSDWYRLRVIDEGEGISRENLKKVATPYFTTKDRGDTGRGFGLGLAICRKIVHLHRGNMTITSELNKGTMVQVDIPDHFEQISQESKPVVSSQVASVMAEVA
jgi:signal transduction histidine kinase